LTPPVDGTRQALAERLAKTLAGRGTEVAFGVPGGGPNLDVVGALAANDIRFVLAHGETAACIMASVFGYVTGQVSAAVVTRGPGAVSAANGAAQATLDRHPLVLITDTVPAESAARVPHQRVDQRALFAPICKASATLNSSLPDDQLDALVALATKTPAGAVHLDYDTSAADPIGRGSGTDPPGYADTHDLPGRWRGSDRSPTRGRALHERRLGTTLACPGRPDHRGWP